MKSYLPLLLLSFGLFLSSCGGKGKISIKNTNFVDEISLNQNLYFEFNQDNSIEFDAEYRSPGWDRYKKNKILKWKK